MYACQKKKKEAVVLMRGSLNWPVPSHPLGYPPSFTPPHTYLQVLNLLVSPDPSRLDWIHSAGVLHLLEHLLDLDLNPDLKAPTLLNGGGDRRPSRPTEEGTCSSSSSLPPLPSSRPPWQGGVDSSRGAAAVARQETSAPGAEWPAVRQLQHQGLKRQVSNKSPPPP